MKMSAKKMTIDFNSCLDSLDCLGVRSSKVEKILKSSLDLIQSPSPSVKIQIMGGKVCLRCKGKTLLGIIFASTNPQYHKILFIGSPVQYMKIPTSEHVVYI